jgi:hypothetical protein
VIEVIPGSQLSPPSIIHDYCRTELGSLHNGLNFATILRALANSFCEQKIDSAFLIAIAALKEGLAVKKGQQPVFGGSTFQELFSNGVWDQYAREEQAELGKEIEMIQSDDAGTVDCTAGRPHSNYVRSVLAKISSPNASAPKANSAFPAFCSAWIVFRCSTMLIAA